MTSPIASQTLLAAQVAASTVRSGSTPGGGAAASAGATSNSTASSSSANTESGTPSATDIVSAKAAAANSATYSFASVTQNARTVLDAGERAYGKQPDMYTTATQWDQTFGGMDRRSLYAVASNSGGQFSVQEQGYAKEVMFDQVSAAMRAGSANPPYADTTSMGNAIAFLNNVSPEEKQSPLWALTMAGAKTGYNVLASEEGKPQVADDGTNPLVKVLMAAMKAAQYDPSKDRTTAGGDSLASILSNPWAKGFEDQIQAAYAAAVPQGSVVNLTV